MRALCGLLFLWVAAASADPKEDALATLDECIASFSDRGNASFQEIAEQCGTLPEALGASEYGAWLPQDWWSERLTLRGLDELAGLMQARDRLVRPPVDASLLKPILADLRNRELAQPRSLIERIRDWLHAHLRRPGQTDASWLEKWVDWVARHTRTIDVVSWALFVLLIAATGAIVYSELRTAGFLRRRSREAAAGTGLRGQGGVAGVSDIGDLERLERSQRPSLVLELIVAALAKPGRPGDRALTHRELQRKMRGVAPDCTPGFDMLARCAERVRYSPFLPPDTEIDAAVASGRDVLSALSRQAVRA